MPDIEVAAGVFAAKIVGILWQADTVAKVPIRAHVVQGMGIGVTGYHAQTVIIPRSESGLQTVVIGFVDISHLKDVAQERKFRIERSWRLLVSGCANIGIVSRGCTSGD